MIRVMTIEDVRQLLKKVTLERFFLRLIEQLKSDFARWPEFRKSPRHAIQSSDGIIELMPTADKEYYSFKYVNGHPNNTQHNKLTVVAVGQLSSVKTGYPLLLSEMTVLTALRTAATSALASQFLAPKGAQKLGIIGTGAQSEFQVLAHHYGLGIREVFYFDVDAKAMLKFAKNLEPYRLKLHPCKEGRSVLDQCDLITTATARPGRQKVLEADWVKPGMHINKIGGDSPGKTELDPRLVEKCKIVVELTEQTRHEGEIQQVDVPLYAELWELAAGKKKGRESPTEITLFDSVGFALEDYSVLRLVHELATDHHLGHKLDLIPDMVDPKNLFGVIA
ncbi:MAG: ornithine cyclodeaminase [Verrucomicrobia bacterium]|nr:ornithine cyclodeaminase [Verrucomicrobiota bacterium]MBU6445928.1 ornithine cyclodeaminase [Verrucomicrobiota bacterium]MDE3047524.1 ornithine cyclodeaminase [Verrucomicrobiota bacterium]